MYLRHEIVFVNVYRMWRQHFLWLYKLCILCRTSHSAFFVNLLNGEANTEMKISKSFDCVCDIKKRQRQQHTQQLLLYVVLFFSWRAEKIHSKSAHCRKYFFFTFCALCEHNTENHHDHQQSSTCVHKESENELFLLPYVHNVCTQK